MLLPSTALAVCNATLSTERAVLTLVSPISDLDSNTVTNPQPPWSPCLSLCSRPWPLVAAGDSSSGSRVSSGWEQPVAAQLCGPQDFSLPVASQT